MPFNDQLSSLLEHVYEAPLHPEGWDSLVPALEQALHARVGLFKRMRSSVGFLSGCSASTEDQMTQYVQGLWLEDRAVAALGTARVGDVIADTQLVTARERLQSPFYNDFLGSMDSERGIYAPFLQDDSGIYYVSAQRSARRGDYDGDEVRLLRSLAPHLQRSARTWLRLQQANVPQTAAAQALTQAGMGVILVDRTGKLLFANEIAEGHLTGQTLSISNGQVRIGERTADQALRKAISVAAREVKPAADTVELPACGRLGPLSVMITPLQEKIAINGEPVVMLLLGVRPGPQAEPSALSRACSLTPAETRLLSALVDGERLGDYARRTGISVTTAKSHLKALFDKTGERRQANLIRRALADPILRMSLPETRD